MASQVLSGSSGVSYTNNTGQNVRIVINYMANGAGGIAISWAGVSASIPLGTSAIGRNLAFQDSDGGSGNNGFFGFAGIGGLPTELMLAPGQTFTASCGAYNIVVIPEAG